MQTRINSDSSDQMEAEGPKIPEKETEEEVKKKKEVEETTKEWLITKSNCITDIVVVLLLQSTIVIFLLVSSFSGGEINFPKNVSLAICRIICSMLLHLVLAPDL